jgi:hypothetical protein
MLPLEDQIELARLNGDTEFQINVSGAGAQGNRYIEPVKRDGETRQTTTTSRGGTGTGTGGGGGGGTGGSAPTPTAAPAESPVQTTPTLQIYGGAQWFRITDPSGTEASEKWVAVYTLPGGQQIYFEASPEQMAALFGTGQPSTFGAMSQGDLDQQSQTRSLFFAGNISEVETPTGENFLTAYERAVAEGLGTGIVPEEFRGNAEIESLIFIAEHEDWSDDRLLEQVSKTQVFMARYPEIDTFRKQGLNVAESVDAYREYENMVNQLNIEYEGHEATREDINRLIRGQKSAKTIQSTYQVFERFEENHKALSAFNEILSARGIPGLDSEGMFDFLSGQADDEIYEIYAESSVLEAGEAAGLGDVLSAGDVGAIVDFLGPDIQFERAFEGMSQAARLILQFRQDINLGSLNPDDLIDLSLGVAPRSGANQAQIAQEMERSLSSARAFLQNRVRPRTQDGRAVGFRRLRGESLD